MHTYLTPETQGRLSVITMDGPLLGVLRTMGGIPEEYIVYAGSSRNTRIVGRAPLGTLVEMQSECLPQEYINLCVCSWSPHDS